jgi:hypothetical protein
VCVSVCAHASVIASKHNGPGPPVICHECIHAQTVVGAHCARPYTQAHTVVSVNAGTGHRPFHYL